MAELGNIEKPEASGFVAKRKLYVVPTLPFEGLSSQFNVDKAKLERYWGEVKEKIDYFVSTYGKIGFVYLEGIDADRDIKLEFFEKSGKESNHYKLMKSLVDANAKLKGIDKDDVNRRSELLFEEYSKSMLPEIMDIHKGFYGNDIDFNKWREYLINKVQEMQDDLTRTSSKILEEMPDDTNGVLFIIEGRPIEFPKDTDVFQIRPPAFDEIIRKIRNSRP
ncbi:MAG: hypothetical protein J5U17_10650 [Candidatus Methanoperedens sp.]|nr:hypothetical protein [Candidatus Methanoperedens sp.]